MEYYLGLNSESNFDFKLFSIFSGVGMIRGENLCISKMQYFLNPNFCNYTVEYLSYVAKSFDNKNVWYRTADLVPHQINLLDGCDAYLNEDQYLIGNRGIRRNLQFYDTYLLELNSFLKAYQKHNNLGILIPYVSNIEEVKKVKKILENIGYKGKIGIMIEIPSLIFMLDELEELGIDNYTIGVNDLTSNILGAKRDIDAYSINNEAVYKAIEYVTKKVHSFGKKVTVAGYLNKEMLDYVKKIGVDILNIHYNEIPILFNGQDSNFFEKHYNDIKANYKSLKKKRENDR